MLCLVLVLSVIMVLVSCVSGEFFMLISVIMCVLVVCVVFVLCSRLGFLLDCEIMMYSVLCNCSGVL